MTVDLIAAAARRTIPEALQACGLEVRPMAPVRRLFVSASLPAREQAAARLQALLGVELAQGPRATRTGRFEVLPLGPGDWWIEWPATAPDNGLSAQLAAEPGLAVADVSDAFAGLALSGETARDLLSIGCPLDLRPERFPPDACARTLFGRIDVVLTSTPGGFGLRFDRAWTTYAWLWLQRATEEFRG